MSKHSHFKPVYIATILALLSSLVFTFNVVADDPTPVPPTPEETALPPTETPPPPTTETVVTELLDSIPENTSVVLTVDNEIVPLATTEASDLILVGDPIWCPAGVLPDPLVNGCTDSYPDLESLIDDIDNAVIPEPSEDGTIWIMAGTDASTFDLNIDGSVFTNWSNYSLTLQGGWDGGTSGDITDYSTFNVSLSIMNWNNTVTLNQIIIDGANSTGLNVSTDGDIVLEDVTASNNDGYGAELSATGSITLDGNNTFNNNIDSGLHAETDFNIDGENITASDNGIYGAELYSLNDIILSGDNTFNNNGLSGVYAEADANIETENLTASDNGDYGAELYSLNNVILSGTNTFDNNANTGLYVEADNTIEIENLNASSNDGYGAELYAPVDVALQGSNLFTNNLDSGLYVGTDGSINAENITANGNGGNGVTLYSTGTVTISGANIFSGNQYSGIYVEADDDTLFENFTTDGNGVSGVFGSGVELYTLGSATIAGTNIFINNLSDGVTVTADGDIFITNITATNNGANGLSLDATGEAEITCGVLSNTGYEIEADTGGLLILNGVDFGDDVDNEIAADEDYLVLNSNQCYTYPDFSDPSDEPDEPNEPGEPDNIGNTSPSGSAPTTPEPELPINTVASDNAQKIPLDCTAYQGTLITLPDGDGAYIPCPIVDTAQLFQTDSNNLPLAVPQGYTYISSFLLTILENGQPLGPLNVPGSIWYATPEQIQGSGVQVFFWNGNEWVEITNRITPFMNVFFKIPQELVDANFAILYWDGVKWIEIAEPGHLGDGYIIKTGGHKTADGLYFEATVNFTGTFILVNK